MPQPAENAPEPEAKHSRGLASYVVWGFVAVMFYVLSVGPALRLSVKKPSLISAYNIIYSPLGWLYHHTPFHKPLRMYMHFWTPEYMDKSAE